MIDYEQQIKRAESLKTTLYANMPATCAALDVFIAKCRAAIEAQDAASCAWVAYMATLHGPAAPAKAEATARVFPIHSEDRRELKTPPYAIAWDFLAPHEAQALANHDQTLERLAERGGCGWSELFCIVRGLHWREQRRVGMTTAQFREAVLADLEKWREQQWAAAARADAQPEQRAACETCDGSGLGAVDDQCETCGGTGRAS